MVSVISQKHFTPTEDRRVCSENFTGVKKTYLNNLPPIVPKTTRLTIPKPRTTTKARSRETDILKTSQIDRNIHNIIDRENVEKTPKKGEVICLAK